MCPICHDGGDRWQPGPSRGGRPRASDLRRCRRCGHRFLPVSDDHVHSLEALYHSSHYSGFARDPVFQRNVREELATSFRSRIPPPATLLDVGCGGGDFLAAASEFGYVARGVDISEAAVARCRERGLEAHAGDFLTLGLPPFDCVTMWDLVEHLPDPQAFLRRAFEVVRPGGYLVVKTPNVAGSAFAIGRAVPRLAGLLLGFPVHVQFFDRATLDLALRQSGFGEVAWLSGRPMRSGPSRRSLRALAGWVIVRSVALLGEGGNFYIMARKPGPPAAATRA